MLLTKSTGVLMGPISRVLGYLMNAIFVILDKIGLPNIGMAIIIFTIVIYMALLPMTIKQQKFSKLQNKMMPEIKKIQERYKDKKDQASMMKQNEEVQAVYKKYGVSPSGSCVQLIIQMPILFALYRVIYNMPAYVTKIKQAFYMPNPSGSFVPVVNRLLETEGASEYLQGTSAAMQFTKQFSSESFLAGDVTTVSNTFIDVLNRFSTGDWAALKEKFSALSDSIDGTTALVARYNNFLGLNMADSPWYTLKEAWSDKAVLLMIGAVMIPLLSAVTQWLSVKLMPTSDQKTGDQQQDSMAQQMKTMNVMMPLMSFYFCFTLPAGMGLYWIAGAVVRTVQQIFVNKHIDKMDIDAMIAENMAKAKVKAEKQAANGSGRETVTQRMMKQYAEMNTRTIEAQPAKKSELSDAEKEKALSAARSKYEGKYRKDSLAAKANMVSEYNKGGSRE